MDHRPEDPLPARVMINQIWSRYFGHGLVRTPSDFGRMGERPSHPNLLDWLAAELVNPSIQRDVLSPKALEVSTLDAQTDTPHDTFVIRVSSVFAKAIARTGKGCGKSADLAPESAALGCGMCFATPFYRFQVSYSALLAAPDSAIGP